jgi:hypothetical protein
MGILTPSYNQKSFFLTEKEREREEREREREREYAATHDPSVWSS